MDTTAETLKRKRSDESGIEFSERKEVKQKTVVQSRPTRKHQVSPELLRIYYDRLFPISIFFRWLSFGDADLIKRREFNFTLEGDVFIRYLAYTTKEDFKKDLLKKLPHKIDVGAIFNTMPSMHQSVSNLVPEQKELVFDIDMTDYDDVRNCCSDAKICHLCWPLMTAAVEVMHVALTDDFGFENIMWVFSGRRGIHCWVCDERARRLSNHERDAVVSYLSLEMGGDKKRTRDSMDLGFHMHTSLNRAYRILSEFFEAYVEDQGLFETKQSWADLISDVVDDQDIQKLGLSWVEDSDPVSRWQALKKAVAKLNAREKRYLSTRYCLQKIVFKHMYPRLDVNVSKHRNHLLKSPFSVHPKTGNVCVPFDPATVRSFSPFTVPTIDALHEELNSKSRAQASPRRQYEGTSLEPFINAFKKFVDTVAPAVPRKGAQSMEF